MFQYLFMHHLDPIQMPGVCEIGNCDHWNQIWNSATKNVQLIGHKCTSMEKTAKMVSKNTAMQYNITGRLMTACSGSDSDTREHIMLTSIFFVHNFSGFCAIRQ